MAKPAVWEELETLDQPRGIVAAANRYAAEKVPLDALLSVCKRMPEGGAELLEAGKVIYKQHFDAFIAGAHGALDRGSAGDS